MTKEELSRAPLLVENEESVISSQTTTTTSELALMKMIGDERTVHQGEFMSSVMVSLTRGEDRLGYSMLATRGRGK